MNQSDSQESLFLFRRKDRSSLFGLPVICLMVSERLLEIICCPCTGERLRVADLDVIQGLKQESSQGRLFNRLGVQVESEITEGLVNSTATYFIMVRNGIPELSPDHVIPIDHLEFTEPN